MFSFDPTVLQEFEENLNTRYPEKSKIPAKIIGFGEISTVFSIEHPLLKDFAFKRISIFSQEKEIKEYDTILKEYITILRDKIKIHIISTEGISIKTKDNNWHIISSNLF